MNLIQKQINQAVMRDGLLDLVAGAGLIIVSAVFLLQSKLIPFVAVPFLLLKPLLEWLKSKFVHPRAGYVKLIEDNEAEAKGIAVTAALATAGLAIALVVLVLAKGAHHGKVFFMRWVFPGAASLLFAMGPLYLGSKYMLKRGYAIAFSTVVTGVFITVTGVVTGYRAVGVICLQAGFLLLLTGTVLFTRFLNSNPVQEMTNE